MSESCFCSSCCLDTLVFQASIMDFRCKLSAPRWMIITSVFHIWIVHMHPWESSLIPAGYLHLKKKSKYCTTVQTLLYEALECSHFVWHYLKETFVCSNFIFLRLIFLLINLTIRYTWK